MLDFLKLPIEVITLGLPVSDELVQRFAPALGLILVQLIITIIFERRLHERLPFEVIVTAVALFMAAGMTTYFLWNPTVVLNGDALATFLLFILTWGIFFHLLAYHFGHRWLTPLLGSGWVKGIDYLYLAGSFYGIYRLVLGLMSKEASIYDLSLPLLLGVALALRFTKTSAEIFKWDKAPDQRA